MLCHYISSLSCNFYFCFTLQKTSLCLLTDESDDDDDEDDDDEEDDEDSFFFTSFFSSFCNCILETLLKEKQC